MTKVISISQNKGGVLKTSLVVNLAGVLATQGKRVLIIDTDNQGNALISFNQNPDKCQYTLYDVLVDGLPVQHAIMNVHENIDVLPSNDDMSFFELDVLPEIAKYPTPFGLLKNAMQDAAKDYDYIFIDTPPNLGLVQANVLEFATDVIIPFQPEVYSMRSLAKMVNTIAKFKSKTNAELNLLGVVPTLYDRTTTLHEEVLQECRKFCLQNDIKVFETIIPKSIKFAKAIAYEKKPATLLKKKDKVVDLYTDLANELLAEVTV
ncbi:ParA family protein [Bacillus cereus]|uniref:ParA family protein n=1 Tax=Bacillus cereus TaxID=1396 RepID=UPI000BF2A406|nr:ParA family protein [Bacillus cereus]PER25383.1 chromosome partitioning protein ParA [Bacillus cereus]